MSLEPRIVHADEWLAVIEKPPGLVVHATPGHRGPTLVDLLGELLAGGALGNLADRVRADAVTDFIDLPLWPAFNLADVAITLGAVGLVASSLGAAGRSEGSAGSG